MSDELYTVVGRVHPFSNNQAGDLRAFAQIRLRNVTKGLVQSACDRLSGHDIVVTDNYGREFPGYIVNLATRAESITSEVIELIVYDDLPRALNAIRKAKAKQLDAVEDPKGSRKKRKQSTVRHPPQRSAH